MSGLTLSSRTLQLLRRLRSDDDVLDQAPPADIPVAPNSLLAANVREVPLVTGPAHQIRLLPHLENSGAPHFDFDPITRECIEGAPPIEIGRFVDSKPTGRNSLTDRITFKSKVVSRVHAEIWCEANGEFYILDMFSSTGTFLNNIRLSRAGFADLRPHLLKDGDILQLGIDYVDYEGGLEQNYRCVKIRVEIDHKLQASPNRSKNDASSLVLTSKNTADTSFKYRSDAQDAAPDAVASVQDTPGGTGPAKGGHFRSMPGTKDSTLLSSSQNGSNLLDYSVPSARETASHSPIESVHTVDEFLELETLMQQKLPLDLTGEVAIADFQRFKYGGFAFVYKGVWKGRDVAVKVLKATKNVKRPAPWEASMHRRLNRETKVWAALLYPNIAEFLGFAEGFGDFPAMISTWYTLGTARDYLDDNEDMAVVIRLRLVQGVADGLAYLHRLKIIHGDLKPTNVLIDDNHVARLCDFGLVRLDDWQGPAGMTTTSPYTGTERYKAPELFITIDNRYPRATCEGDIWALGCVALEFIESKIPYERYSHPIELAKAISDGEPPASQPSALEPTQLLPQYFWYFLEGCWAWYPENRVKINQVVEELVQLSELPGQTANA